MGSAPTLTLPVTSTSTGYVTLKSILGSAYLEGNYGAVRWVSTTTVDPIVFNSAATYVVANGLTSLVPVSWTTGNTLDMIFIYEAA